jgi:hypothetical protein
MKSFSRNEIHPVKMLTNPPKEIVNAGMKIIGPDGCIYEFVGIGWQKKEKAEQKDYSEIPQLTN